MRLREGWFYVWIYPKCLECSQGRKRERRGGGWRLPLYHLHRLGKSFTVDYIILSPRFLSLTIFDLISTHVSKGASRQVRYLNSICSSSHCFFRDGHGFEPIPDAPCIRSALRSKMTSRPARMTIVFRLRLGLEADHHHLMWSKWKESCQHSTQNGNKHAYNSRD